ncbi:hypothetical protein DdX_10559 [Ditylenchus destructor]|uniref:Secreted protein n=1 Tax=Ditylenchus destructor TaxID=166010 RepID=A0AAD4N0N9_9BILA|nr:hypothetical protein DdX_10559 [Ditylenchus destructor]
MANGRFQASILVVVIFTYVMASPTRTEDQSAKKVNPAQTSQSYGSNGSDGGITKYHGHPGYWGGWMRNYYPFALGGKVAQESNTGIQSGTQQQTSNSWLYSAYMAISPKKGTDPAVTGNGKTGAHSVS